MGAVDSKRTDAIPIGRQHCTLLMRLHVGVNSVVSKVMLKLSESGTSSSVLRWVTGLVVLGLMMNLIRWLRLSSQDLQLGYWLGDLPTIVLACLLASLTLLAGGFAYALHIMLFRQYQTELKRTYGQSHYREVEYRCYFSLGTLRCLLAAVTFLALAAMFLAAITFKSAVILSEALDSTAHGGRCGLGGASEAIELAHKELSDFHHKCLEDAASKGKLVYECPGFAEIFPEFPQKQPYVHYLAVTEKQQMCTGFCHVAARPLFARHHVGHDAARNAAAPPPWALVAPPRPKARLLSRATRGTRARDIEEERRPCATYVGDYLQTWARGVGVWSFVLGPLLALIGVALLTYDEL